MVSINIERAFTGNGKKICLLTTDVLLRAAAGELAKSKNLQDWTARNAVLLPPFLKEIAETLLKILAKRISENEAENSAEESNTDKESWSDKDNDKSAKTRSTKDAMARDATDRITADCDGILAFIQAVALKAPRFQASPLSLQA